jgi:D-alanine--poly(phosphoribitol) ligase subunit 1
VSIDYSATLWGGPPEEGCLVDRVMSVAEREPDRIAVVDGDLRISYGDLLGWAAQIADVLAEYGIDTGHRVAIACARGAHSVAALLAVVLSGNAYVPLDLGYPRRRLEHMLDDSSVRVMLHTGGSVDVTTDATPIRIPEFDRAQAGERFGGPRRRDWLARHDPDLPVYVIYTSGSTGWPKGVVLQHSCLDNVATWQAASSLAPDLRTAQFAPLNFDVSFQEIFGTLCGGGTLVLLPERLRRDGRQLLEWLARERIQRMFLPYVALQMLAVAAELGAATTDLSLVEVNVAGEQLVCTNDIRAFFERLPNCRLANHYGQSESAMVSWQPLSGRPADWPMLPPIGLPLPGCELLVDVLGDDPSDAGELLVAGAPVALGYLDRPELNARRYVDIGPTRHGHTRAFRTGDLVRFVDGAVRFLTRMDDDVKLRGIRINLAEVEAQLMAQPEIAAAVAVVLPIGSGPRALRAAVVLRAPERPVAEPELLRRLRETLPDVSVPVSVTVLGAMPRTPSGKLDRDAVADTVRSSWVG